MAHLLGNASYAWVLSQNAFTQLAGNILTRPTQNNFRKEEINMSSPESGWNQEIVPIYQYFFTLFYHL